MDPTITALSEREKRIDAINQLLRAYRHDYGMGTDPASALWEAQGILGHEWRTVFEAHTSAIAQRALLMVKVAPADGLPE